MILGTFMEIPREDPNLATIGHKFRALYIYEELSVFCRSR